MTHEYVPLATDDVNHVKKAAGGRKSPISVVHTFSTPNLKPDLVSGVCCPVGTIYNHEPPKSFLRAFLFAFEVVLHFMLLSVNLMRTEALMEFLNEENEGNGTLDEEEIFEVEESLEYMDDCMKFCFFSVVSTWFLWNIFTRVLFFCFYTPRNVFDEASGTYLIYKPSLIAKLFFPLATVYYHEESSLATLQLIPTYLLGCIYSVFCYKPSYQKKWDEEARKVTVVHAVSV